MKIERPELKEDVLAYYQHWLQKMEGKEPYGILFYWHELDTAFNRINEFIENNYEK